MTPKEQRVMVYHELQGADKLNQGHMPYRVTSKPLDSRRLLADMPRYERNVGARWTVERVMTVEVTKVEYGCSLGKSQSDRVPNFLAS